MPRWRWSRSRIRAGIAARSSAPTKASRGATRDAAATVVGPATILACSNCGQPTYFDVDGRQYPGVPYGDDVSSLPPDVDSLYGEARRSYSANAYTAAVLACRKILMNIAVAKGAKAGDPFIVYVEYLANSGYVPPDGKGWVDHIRKKGNEATHEIALMTAADAEELISFVEMLLKFVYEFPARVPAAT
jgi:hypothetical protein